MLLIIIMRIVTMKVHRLCISGCTVLFNKVSAWWELLAPHSSPSSSGLATMAVQRASTLTWTTTESPFQGITTQTDLRKQVSTLRVALSFHTLKPKVMPNSMCKPLHGTIMAKLSDSVCHLCRASRKIKRLNFMDARRNARHRSTMYTHEQYMGWTSNGRSELCNVIGWHLFRVWIDAQHCLDIGIYQHWNGSCLWVFASTTRIWPQ